MKIDYTMVLSFGCLCLVVADIPGFSVQAKSLETLLQQQQDSPAREQPAHVIHKRNSWWSKKSSLPATELERKPHRNLAASLLSGPVQIRSGGAWWSKKSVDSARVPEGEWFDKAAMSEPISSAATEVLDNQLGFRNRKAIDCYSGRCITDLVLCQQRSQPSQNLNPECHLRHRLCVSKCFHTDDILLDPEE